MKIPAVVLALLLCTAISLPAQLTVPFTAKEGYTPASKLNTGLTDVRFKGAGVVAYSYDAQLFTLNVGMNLDNGKSDVWGYLFTAKTAGGQDTSLLHLMYKPVIGNIAPLPIPVDIPIPDTMFRSADLDTAWLNSPTVVARLKTNATFQAYRQKNPDSLYAQYAFVFDTPLEQSQWVVTVSGEGYPSLTCFVNAVSGEVLCAGLPTSVGEAIVSTLHTGKVWPLPARDEVYVSIGDPAIHRNGVFTLYTETGARLRDYPGVSLSDSPAVLPVTGVPDGWYLLRYEAAGTTLTFPVIISR